MRVLYLSQLAEPARIRELGLPPEAETIPALFAGLGATADVVDVTVGPPTPADGYDGVVVGGSIGSANDTEPWRLALLEWLRTPKGPLLGICGGHQLYARARGGVVAPMGFRQAGVYPLALPDIPGFTGEVVQMHGDHVTEVPAGAEVWARDDACIQALRYPGHTWTFQFHPELTLHVAGLARTTCEGWRDGELGPAVAGGGAILRAWLAGLRKP